MDQIFIPVCVLIEYHTYWLKWAPLAQHMELFPFKTHSGTEKSRRFPSKQVLSQSPGVILDPSVPFTSQVLSMLVQAALLQNLSQMHLIPNAPERWFVLAPHFFENGSLVIFTPPIHLPNNRINIPTKHKSGHIIPMCETLHPKVKFSAILENSVSPSSPSVFSHLLTTWNSDPLCSSDTSNSFHLHILCPQLTFPTFSHCYCPTSFNFLF